MDANNYHIASRNYLEPVEVPELGGPLVRPDTTAAPTGEFNIHRMASRNYLSPVELPRFASPSASLAQPEAVFVPYGEHGVASTASSLPGRQTSHDSETTIIDLPSTGHLPYTAGGPRPYLQGKDVGSEPTAPTVVVPVQKSARRGTHALIPEITLERTFFYTLWFLIQLTIFLSVGIYYLTTSDYKTARETMGPTLALSRAGAYCIIIDASFILLLVSRNFLSYLRSTFVSRYITIDKNIHAHKVVGWTIVFMTFLHVFGHTFNLTHVAAASAGAVTGGWLFFLSPVGITGNLMVVLLAIMVTCAMARVRRPHFELFYYTHHLFIPFYILLIAHGSFCVIEADNAPVCRGHPDFWKFFLIPAIIYLVERITREVRGRRPTQISRVVQHPSRVVQIQIKKESLKAKTGQYIYINCPEISRHQWHPFTLTSAPEDDFISIHMRMAGDWTREFAERLGCSSGKAKGAEPEKRFNPLRSRTLRRPGGRGGAPTAATSEFNPGEVVKTFGLPRIMVDGPFGAPTEHVFDYEVAVLVGAGIGVTPFASVLKSLWYRTTQPGKLAHLRKVYFFWICRDIQAFEWFQDLLVALEEENLGDFLEVRAYLTGRLSEDQIRNLAIHSTEEGPDALTGRKTPTYFGRPNFDQIFADIAAQQLRKKVGVFFCGPKPVATTLKRVCRTYSSAQDTNGSNTGTVFEFHKEHF
ncbi:hypothetical protein IWQ60_004698 [Tieghemiomyces parasiticus]|uniref:FAD-binding FR-type domain-containing protein n=1 Tax=Tieghemiomyces parasiticus TaxID=78921 RepID=A0A9W8DVA4_9FUNG|nr:hypothetical protein IWQ60_004698 [Tieghemiomyces parasiticus]